MAQIVLWMCSKTQAWRKKNRDLNIGCYVVRGVLTSAQLAAWHQALTDSVAFIANKRGTRAVDLKGDRGGLPAYRTIQATTGHCTCKYAYAATGKHISYKVSDVQPFSEVCDWVHARHNVDRLNYFDEIVANVYSRAANQCAGYHTDQSELLGATSNILSEDKIAALEEEVAKLRLRVAELEEHSSCAATG